MNPFRRAGKVVDIPSPPLTPVKYADRIRAKTKDLKPEIIASVCRAIDEAASNGDRAVSAVNHTFLAEWARAEGFEVNRGVQFMTISW